MQLGMDGVHPRNGYETGRSNNDLKKFEFPKATEHTNIDAQRNPTLSTTTSILALSLKT